MKELQAWQRRSGISLYTLLAAVVVLGVLGSVLVTSFSGSHSKGQALWALTKNVGAAAKRFHLDTGCYPAQLDALFSLSAANRNNHCGQALPEGQWHGPYIEQMTTNDGGQALLPSFGPNTRLDLQFVSGVDPQIMLYGLEPSIRSAISDVCELPHGKFAGVTVGCFFSGSRIEYDYLPNTNQ